MSVQRISDLQAADFRVASSQITTQGDTSTPSVVRIDIKDYSAREIGNEVLRARVRICNDGTLANSTNATIAPTGGATTLETHTSNKDLTIQSSEAASATGTLTISGVVVDGETVTIGTEVFEFDTHDDSTITSGRVRVDISGDATKSQGTLTVDTQPTAGDTMTVGAQTYAFVANGTANAAGEISVGADLAGAQAAIVAAINGTDGFNSANAQATIAAFSSDDAVITAKEGGTAGDSVVTTETFTAGTNVFDAGTLGTTTAGVDCAAADAATALRAAIAAHAATVATAGGSSGTVSLTAKATGEAYNVATTETMANGAFGAATLTGGKDDKAYLEVAITDATAETVTLEVGPPLVGAEGGTDWSGARIDITHAAP